MVFIGRDLDEKLLTKTFNACLATRENLERKASTLRFQIGDAVLCATGVAGECVGGTVVGHLMYDARMPQGMFAPYQVRLEDGRTVVVPKDCATMIRSANGDDESGETDMDESGDSEWSEDMATEEPVT